MVWGGSMRNYICFYAADGTLNMPSEKKVLFRLWALSELQSAYSDFEVVVSEERSTAIYSTSESNNVKRKNMLSFVTNLAVRWTKYNL